MLPMFLRNTKKYLSQQTGLFNPKFVRSFKRIRTYRGIHTNQRCFIIGNGPSLQKMDLSQLNRELIFGLNRIYLLFDKYNFTPSYYVSVNHLVIQQSGKEIISKVQCPKFIDWDARKYIEYTSDMIFLKSYHQEPRFFTDISRGIWQGMTVTYVALQIAYYMGFEQVILIGVDHSFTTKGTPHKIITSQGDDLDHFDKSYFGSGYQWQLPDLDGSEVAYKMADYQFKKDGREIIDATVGGKLNVFRKVKYSTLF